MQDALTRRRWFRSAMAAAGGVGAPALAACGVGGGSQAASGSQTPVTVLFWCRDTPDNYAKLLAAIDEFRRRNPHITINDENASMPDNEFTAKLLASFAAGSAPDTFWNNTRGAQPLQAAGGLADVTQNLSRAKLTTDKFYGNAVEELTVAGKIYGVPQGWGIGLLGLNRALFRSAGVDLRPDFDKTWTNEQFVTMLQRVARSDAQGNLGTWGIEWGAGLATIMPLIWAFGGDLLDKDKKKAVIAQGTGSIEALQWWYDLTYRFRVHPRRGNADRPQGVNMWTSGRQALNGNAGPNVLHQWVNLDFEWDVVLRPNGPKGRHHRFYSNAYYMWSASKVKDAAWQLISFAGTDGMKATEDAGGYNIPSYKVIADTIWAKKTTNNVNRLRFLEAAKDGKAQPLVVQWDPMNSIVSTQMNDLLDQKLPAKMAVDNIDREVTALLASGR